MAISVGAPESGSGQEQPLVSVIVNCYNGEQYLREAIESVLAQTYRNWELVFWDNQSTDRSAEIFKSYRDPRLSYHYAPRHTWLYEARNYAIEKSAGEFIAFLDVDDWWEPTKLQRQVALFADPAVGLVYGQFWVGSGVPGERRTAPKRPLPTGWIVDDLLQSNFIGMLTLVVRRAALDSLAFRCDPRFHIIGDFDLAIRLALRWKAECVQEPIAFRRLHGESETSKHYQRMVDELQTWMAEMSGVDGIASSKNFVVLKAYGTYLQAMNLVLGSHREQAARLLPALPWGRFKLRLCVALTLPTFLVRKLNAS